MLKRILFGMAVVVAAVFGGSTPAHADESVVAVSKDSYVQFESTENFGSNIYVRADASPEWYGIMQFAVPDCTITSAVLQVTPSASHTAGLRVHAAGTGDFWAESTVNWFTADWTAVADEYSTSNALVADESEEIDLMAPDGGVFAGANSPDYAGELLTLRISSNSVTQLSLKSKENSVAAEYKPLLIVNCA